MENHKNYLHVNIFHEDWYAALETSYIDAVRRSDEAAIRGQEWIFTEKLGYTEEDMEQLREEANFA